MKELVDRFLNYIYKKNSHSQDTVDSYRRDLERPTGLFEFYLYVSIRESGQTSNYCA